jgi:hypothetical protein
MRRGHRPTPFAIGQYSELDDAGQEAYSIYTAGDAGVRASYLNKMVGRRAFFPGCEKIRRHRDLSEQAGQQCMLYASKDSVSLLFTSDCRTRRACGARAQKMH